MADPTETDYKPDVQEIFASAVYMMRIQNPRKAGILIAIRAHTNPI